MFENNIRVSRFPGKSSLFEKRNLKNVVSASGARSILTVKLQEDENIFLLTEKRHEKIAISAESENLPRDGKLDGLEAAHPCQRDTSAISYTEHTPSIGLFSNCYFYLTAISRSI
jgi:hypothetical protein